MSDKKYIEWDEETTIEFSDAQHAYRWVERDLFIPGVTTILRVLNKPALVQWAANEASFYVRDNFREGMTGAEMASLCEDARKAHRLTTDKAANIGTEVHQFAERYLGAIMRGDSMASVPTPSSEEAKAGCRAVVEWVAANDVKPLLLEQILFSKRHFYAGTCDFIGYINGMKTLVDFKTSKGLYPEMAMQVAGAYKLAYEEQSGESIEKTLIIRLDKATGEFKVYDIPYNDGLQMRAFISVRDAYRDTKEAEEFINGLR